MSEIEVSVIIPFVNEGSNVIFTTQAMIEELDGFCKYEIILVDNMSHDHLIMKSGDREYPTYSRDFFFHPPKGATPEQIADKKTWSKISTMFFRKGVVKYFTYDLKQGHWNAKNHGIQNSTGKYILFLDAHCIMKRDSVRKMVQFLRDWEGKEYDHPMTPGKKWKVGGVHALINYILDSRCLQYGVERKTFGYKFRTRQIEDYWQGGTVPLTDEIKAVTRAVMNPPSAERGETWKSQYGSDPLIAPYLTDNSVKLDPSWPKRLTRFPDKPYEVPVMSTCAMMCPRSLIDDLGAWHPEFGIYCGGESYINWKQTTCGYSHWIHPAAQCWHHADHRGYSYNHSDFVRNSFIAAYVVGGEKFLQEQVDLRKAKERHAVIDALAEDVRNKCKVERDFIASRQIVDLDSYLDWWRKNQFWR